VVDIKLVSIYIEDMNKCITITKHRLLGFEWTTKRINHEWAYDYKGTRRVCEVCGIKQVLVIESEDYSSWEKLSEDFVKVQ
jgi:hypothetical protein